MLLAMDTSREKDSQLPKNIDITSDSFIELNEIKDRMSLLETELKQAKGNMSTYILLVAR